jgi:peptidoglycan/LPS O-acetylase OafA/YrhL
MTTVTLERARAFHTVSDVLAANKGIAPGFDAMRLALAFAVLSWHSYMLTTPLHISKAYIDSPQGGFVKLILPMFFCLSGFLVTGSIDRVRSLKIFLLNRALRIAPALFVEVIVSAFLLGPVVTTYPLMRYFTNRLFFAYLGNVVGRIRLTLPGVFLQSPVPQTMNLSLWTVPYELDCYLLLSLAIAAGLVGRRNIMLWLVLSFVGLKIALPLIFSSSSPIANYAFEQPGNPYSGYILVLSFLTGVTAYLWRDRIPLSYPLAAMALIAFAVINTFHLGSAFVPVLLGYVTVVLGMVRVPRIPFFSGGDYSYGIYLYAFPIQQTVNYFLPGFHTNYWNIVLAAPIVVVLAWFSWNHVEKPTLRLRKRFARAPTR